MELHVSHPSTAHPSTSLGGNGLFNGRVLCLQISHQL